MKVLMITNILLQLLRGVWCMEASAAEAYKPLIVEVLKKGNIDFNPINSNKENRFSFLSASNSTLVSPRWNTSIGGYDFSSAPKGSIALIPLMGAVMKEDFCGALGTKSIANLSAKAADSPNIIGSLLYVDSPGGAALGTSECSSAIYALAKTKPIVTYCENMMCSAAMWIGSSTNYTIANKNDFCMIGSIGTYIMLEGDNPTGPVIHEIYATASTDKNLDFREAKKGNYDLLLNNTINPLNDTFIAAMTRNRYGKGLNKTAVFTGKVFQAVGAKEKGLVDQVGTMNDAILKIQELSKK